MGSTMVWALLLLFGLLDVAWATSVKMAEGYSRLSWATCSGGPPLGTADAVWTGIGAIGSIAIAVPSAQFNLKETP